MDKLKFGNWQEFLDKAVYNLQKDAKQMKTFKNLKNDCDRIEFASQFKADRDWKWITEYFESTKTILNGKSSAVAENLRLDGNKLFKKKKFTDSLMSYNQSIANAPVATKECNDMALAVANRSAVFYHLKNFQLCLHDVDLALKLNYPTGMHYKLFQRAGQCYLQLNQLENAFTALKTAKEKIFVSSFKDDKTRESCLQEIDDLLAKVENVPKSSTQEGRSCDTENKSSLQPVHGINSILTQATIGVDLQMTDSKGRHLVANRCLNAGDILIVERPYAAILLPSHYGKRCHHCLAVIVAVYPCRKCSAVSYCSEQCSQASWDIYHHIECSYYDLLYSVGIAHLSLRIVLVAGLNYLLQFKNTELCKNKSFPGLTEDGKYDCDYSAVYHLMPHTDHIATEDLFQYTLTANLLLMSLDNSQFFSDIQDNGEVRCFIGSLLLRHICQLVCNAHAITEIERCHTSPSSTIDISSQVRMATAIYPTASLMNHSCDPSIISSFVNDVLVVRAVKDVKPGDEVYNCYGPHWKRMSRLERQQHLSEQYFFKCQCKACCQEQKQEQVIQAFLCRHCSGPVTCTDGVFRCNECSQNVNDDVQVLIERVQNADFLWTRGLQLLKQDLVDEALKSLLDALRLRQLSLYRHNKDLAEIHDAIARCYAQKGDFVASCRHLAYSVATTEVIYGSTSIELANELVKYAEVCASSRQVQLAQSVAERALKIFTINYGADCGSVGDLRQLIAALTT